MDYLCLKYCFLVSLKCTSLLFKIKMPFTLHWLLVLEVDGMVGCLLSFAEVGLSLQTILS